MSESRMHRSWWRLPVAASILAAFACNDANLDPRPAAPRAATSRPVLDRGGIPNADAPESYEFDIDTAASTISLGDRFTLSFPANAVCDPSSSSYGVGHWNDDCVPTARSVNVHAKIWQRDGRVYVDFSPALRFAPSANVTISTTLLASMLAGRADLAATPRMLHGYALQYSPDGSSRVNEVATLGDSSLLTHIDLQTGLVWRRIKHFSGYVIAYSGEPCDPDLGDPLCIWVDDPSEIVPWP